MSEKKFLVNQKGYLKKKITKTEIKDYYFYFADWLQSACRTTK